MDKNFAQQIKQLYEGWKGLDSGNKQRIATAVVIVVLLFTGILYFGTRKDYVVLYSNLEAREAGEIISKLEEMKVDFKPEGSGTIKVPRSLEAKLRMQLAAEGYPKSGVNFDYAESALGFGATDYDKRQAARISLQNRLQNTIKTLDGVQDAIVTISIPEQDSFVLKEDKQETTASVVLRLSGGTLTPKQVKAIEELVAKSIIGLKPGNISIIDSNMNALNLAGQDEAGSVGTYYELENQVRTRLQKQILSLLEPVFGSQNLIVSVNVRLNFDKQVSEIVRFEPVNDDEGIAVSINELKERVENPEGAPADTQYAVTEPSTGGSYDKTSRTINYEVNQIKEQIEMAQGRIEALTLSVIINATQLETETLGAVSNLVAKAVGVDEENIVVRAMPFSASGVGDVPQGGKSESPRFGLGFTTEDIMTVLRYFLFGLFVIIMLIVLYRIIMKIISSLRESAATVPMPAQSGASLESAEAVVEPDPDRDTKIKQEISQLVNDRPEIAVGQIRNWLSE